MLRFLHLVIETAPLLGFESKWKSYKIVFLRR